MQVFFCSLIVVSAEILVNLPEYLILSMAAVILLCVILLILLPLAGCALSWLLIKTGN